MKKLILKQKKTKKSKKNKTTKPKKNDEDSEVDPGEGTSAPKASEVQPQVQPEKQKNKKSKKKNLITFELSNKNLNFQAKNELLRNMYIIKKKKKEKFPHAHFNLY